MRRLRLLALAVAVALPLAACDEGDSGVDVVTGTISGQVTVDGSGLGNVSVTLSGASSASTTTDASGNYSFQDVAVGSYVVSISGFPSDVTFPQTAKSAVISSSSTTASVNFSGMQVATSSIVGSVTADGNALSGVDVSLSGAGTGSTTTDADGQYAFTGLVAGDYTVSISGFDQSNYNFSSTSQNTSVGVGETSVVGFSGSEAQTATLNVTVTVDGEGRSGVAVEVTGAADRSGTTGSDGQVSFGSLPRGTFSVAITNPDPSNISFDRTNTSVTISQIGGSASAAFSGSTITNSTISGRVYVDVNTNGTYDSGTDTPLELDVSLSGEASSSTTSGSDGTYSFGSLAAGSYTVSITNPDPSAYTFDQTSQSVDLGSNSSATANFRAVERRDGEISGRVWFDNGDGTYTSVDEAAANFTVSYSGPESGSTTTNSEGQYSFGNLLLGEYEVSCDDCDASFAPTSPVTVTLTDGAPTATQDFVSEQGQGSISGQLFIDGNENDTYDVNVDADYDIQGVEVTIEGPDVGMFQSVDTDADGRFTFTELQSGTYNVVIDDADADITDPVALGTTKDVQVGISGSQSATVNYGFDITTWTVRVPVVFGTDGGNENPAEGVTVTAWAKQDLTTQLDASASDADGMATLEINRSEETSIAGERDNIIFTEPTPPAETRIGSEAVIEYTLDPNVFEQEIPNDHNLLWTKVFVVGQYVEQDGTPVSNAVRDALGLAARFGWGDAEDLSDRTATALTDAPNDDVRHDGVARTEDVGEFSFFVDAPVGGGSLPQVYSANDVTGSAQISIDGDVGELVSATVDGSERTVDLGQFVLAYPLPDITGMVWHEANDEAGYQATAPMDDFLNLGGGNLTVNAYWDADDDGTLDATACAIDAATGIFTCTDVPADEDVIEVRAESASDKWRLLTEGGSEHAVTLNDAKTVATSDVSAFVDDLRFTRDMGEEPFSYKFELNTITLNVFNEDGAVGDVDGDGVADGSEDPVTGILVELSSTNVLGANADEFPVEVETDGAGAATFSDVVEGEFDVTIVGASATFAAGIENLRVVTYDPSSGDPIFVDALGHLAASIDLQRTTGPSVTETSDTETQFRGGTIGGFVFDNDDDDLEVDPNELLEGLEVQLLADLDFDAAVDDVVATATTDANGQYLFEDQWEDTYAVKVVNPGNGAADPARRDGVQLVEGDAFGAVIPTSGAGEYDPDVEIDNGDGTAPPLVMNADADDDSDLDFEIVFNDTETRLTVQDGGGAALEGVTVRLLSCDFSTSQEGDADGDDDVDANADDGTCGGGGSLVETQVTDANGQVSFSNLAEGFWQMDPVESTAGDGSGSAANPGEDFWVVRTLGQGDIEVRISTITFP